jgi:hypothetical protein
MNPVDVEAVATHFDDKHKLDEYTEKALVAAKAQHGSDRGTAAHRITERYDLGETILETPLSAYVVASWKAALELADLEVLPEYVERIVVHPDQRIAGRFDRILRNRTTGRLYIGDVKGGENALKWPHAMACQLAMYANAPLIAGPVPDEGGETTRFDPMPDVDKNIGYIFHLPESGEAAVATVDIAAGWQIMEHAVFPIIGWRDRKDLCKPVGTVVGEGGLEAVLEASLNEVRRNELRGRILALPAQFLAEMAQKWPYGVPTFKQSDAHTDDELDQIEYVLTGIDWGGPPEPPQPLEPQPDPLPPAAIDEGATLDADTVDAVKGWIAQLDKVTTTQVVAWVKEAWDAGVSFSLSMGPTQRRLEIMRAAVELSPYDADVVRAAIDLATPPMTFWSGNTIGARFGVLTIDEAVRLCEIAHAIGTTYSVVYDKAGPRLVAA